MIRKLLVGLLALATVAVVAPTSAHATHTTGLVVFGGSATVTPGLCFPGFEESGGLCAPDTTDPLQADERSTWSFDIPSPLPVVGAVCVAAGTFGVDDSCEIDADGTLGANLDGDGVGGSCGMSQGNSTDDPTGSTDTISINDDPLGFSVEWITSAGGTLPLIGEIDGETFVGVTQARPLNQNCATTAAADFTVVGVVVSSGQAL